MIIMETSSECLTNKEKLFKRYNHIHLHDTRIRNQIWGIPAQSYQSSDWFKIKTNDKMMNIKERKNQKRKGAKRSLGDTEHDKTTTKS